MNYVKNTWYVASWSHELKAGVPVGVKILGQPIVLWRNSHGSVTALEDRCVHRLAPLSLGRCEGEKLRCMYHGLLYERSGAVCEIPGQDTIPTQARVKGYPVIDRHSWVWIWMGDAPADASLIPAAVGLEDSDYILGTGQLDYAAEARLINDNLLDFSHLTYVHAQSFGATDEWARERPHIATLPQGVRVERWMAADSASVRGRDVQQPVERYSRYEFLIPGVLLMTGGAFALGTRQRLNADPPDLESALGGVTFTSQAVTPVTEKTARYFFSWGPHINHGDAALRDTLMEIAGRAFAEDRTIIEAQQRIIDDTQDPRIMPTSADRAVILFNQMVAKRVRGERQEASRAQPQSQD